jgi:chromosomal replication initiation ATPase DnaA
LSRIQALAAAPVLAGFTLYSKKCPARLLQCRIFPAIQPQQPDKDSIHARSFHRIIQRRKFTGSDNYVATDDLKLAVNAALTLQRPLLIKGEPGTGKTMLAEEVAAAGPAAAAVAHQVHHQGPAGPVRIRRGLAPA